MIVKIKEVRLQFKRYLTLCKALYKDPRTPTVSKILLWLAIGYALLPFDLIPDFIPILGHLDDLVIIPGLIYLAIQFIPKDVYQKHKLDIWSK